jgi:hypothetical protein
VWPDFVLTRSVRYGTDAVRFLLFTLKI